MDDQRSGHSLAAAGNTNEPVIEKTIRILTTQGQREKFLSRLEQVGFNGTVPAK